VNKKAALILVILTVTLLLLVYGCTTSGNKSDNASTTQGHTSLNTSTGVKSIYDGTYSGTFTYAHPVDNTAEFKDLKWVNESFNVTIALKTLFISDGNAHLDITNISCTEPSFGSGVPTSALHESGDSTAYLPVDPTSTPANPNTSAFLIHFTNGNIIAGIAGKVYISPDGKTISNSSGSNGTSLEGYVPWTTMGPSGFSHLPSGPFSLASWGKWGCYAVSWNLTKVSP